MKDTTTHPPETKPNNPVVSYATYLKTPELLSLQNPLSNPVAHDELLFIVVHQVYELWFKQVIFELRAAIKSLESDNIPLAFRNINRISEIFRILVQQVEVLETMTPTEFNKFRSHLNPASGFQSQQFRELEMLMGTAAEEYEKYLKLNPEWKQKIAGQNETNLREAFVHVFQRKGVLPKGVPTQDGLRIAILWAYESADESTLEMLCENLIKLDEQIQLWRFRHVQMVERMIGMKPGTGGSLGVSYLSMTLKKRFFPELWEARTSMGASQSY